MKSPAGTLFLLFSMLGATAWSQAPAPTGTQFQINTYTTGTQITAEVAVDRDGNFVVVWSGAGPGGSENNYDGVQGRRFAADGTPLGDDFHLNSHTTGGQGSSAVAVDPDGNFVAVWGDDDLPQRPLNIQGRRFVADGTPLGDDFPVTLNFDPFFAEVAVDADGNFVVVWISDGSYGSDNDFWSIQGRRFTADGTPLGGDFQVNTYTYYNQGFPSVAVDPDGDFLVVWESDHQDGSVRSVFGQRFAGDGSSVGEEFRVNTFTPNWQIRPAVAVDPDGNFVVVWSSEGSAGSDSDGYSIQGRRFTADGTPLGDDFQVNTHTTNSQLQPAVAVDRFGNFVVVWDSASSCCSDDFGSIQGRRFSAGGTPLGDDFQVNTYTTGFQFRPSVAVDPDGDFVVVWDSNESGGSDSDGWSIQGRLFKPLYDYGDAPDPPYPTLLASDGARHLFDSGLYLGSEVDWEVDGQPTASADGDDLAGDDEDGVVFTSTLEVGATATVDITASATGNLDGWVDFNVDGDWDDAGEQVFNSEAVPAGTTSLSFAVPSAAALGETFARFRFSSAGGLSATGVASDGEVEDYAIAIGTGVPMDLYLHDEIISWPKTYKACNSITAENFQISSPGDVDFRAGNYVVLKNGFSVHEGSQFGVVLQTPAGCP